MKFLALFLMVFVLLLTIVPCCAWEDSELNVQTSLAAAQENKCPDTNDDCCKDCSPFYVCGTCMGFTFTQELLMNFDVQVHLISHHTNYITTQLPLAPSVIWQPPKFS